MSFPNFTFWSHLLATVGVEVCCLAVVGFVAQCFFRRAVWQRTIWQIIVICLLLLTASEWTGFGRGVVGFLVSKKHVAQNAPASGFLKANPEIARRVARTLDWRPAALRPAVWWPGQVWFAGTVIVLGRMAAAQILLLTLRLRREKIADDSLRKRVLSIAKSVGLRGEICLLRLPESISPMAFGILWPTIGLPSGFESKFSVAEQEAILAHELAHLAAMDPMWFLLADLASALLWWHPLAWWVRRSLHVSSELAADEAAALVPDGPGSLAKCLVTLGKEMTAGRGWGWVGINGGFRSKLGKRVERLMQMPGSANGPLVGWVDATARIAATIFIVPMIVLLFGAFQTAQGESENGWRQSWNTSPGALLLLAALDDTDKHTEDIAKRVQKAKLLYERGKLNESEAILVQILKDAPSNRTAAYYLGLIQIAGDMDRTRKGQITPIPLATNNVVYATVTAGRQEILSKLSRIRLHEVQYDLPLTEVLTQLRVESQEHDPDGVGINFLINPHADAPSVDMGDVRIKISPPLHNLRLIDLLNAITMVADQPIKFSVEDDAVVFSPKPDEAVTLYSKVFYVEPNTFVQGLKSVYATNLNPGDATGVTRIEMDDGPRRPDDGHDAFGGPSRNSMRVASVTRTNQTLQLDTMVRAYFTAAGVNLTDPGKSVFYNDRLGLLLVRASAQDLESIQNAVEALNQQPPQVMIDAKFVELSQQDSVTVGLNRFLQGSTTNVTGIMSDPQFRAAIYAIEHKTDSDILSTPRVTTLSGRQAHAGSTNGDGGVTLDVIAKVGPDGHYIQTAAWAGIKSDNQGWLVSASHQELWDGETLVLGGMTTNQPPEARRLRLVFVTPRIIDSAGNPVHSDEKDIPASSNLLK
jgi:beta-lactamase regulating signal transducer with metallopeptidase domain